MDNATFLERLRQSRLLSEEHLAVTALRLKEGSSPEAAIDSLVGQGALTPFQGRRIWAGTGQGLVLGQYRVLDELGRGGFGHVYKALHTVMGRTVALKVIAPDLVADERARTWFKREVLAVTQLAHPNIVMAYDANEADGQLFLVMEYVDGLNLDALVRKQGPLPIAQAIEMMRQAARALQHAHEKGLVHRDIKPGNLLIPSGALAELATAGKKSAAAPVLVKVVDFGLARLHHNTNGAATLMLQSEKSFMGTPDYVSPEQAQNVHAVDIRSDLYSLGCSFYHALTGQRPFRGTTMLETVVKHLKEDAEPVEVQRPDTPPALAAVVRRLMAKEPVRRFQTPAELIAELDFLCGQEAPRPGVARVAARAPIRPGAYVPPPPRAAPLLAATAMVPDLALQPPADPPPDGAAGLSTSEAGAPTETGRTVATPRPDVLPGLGKQAARAAVTMRPAPAPEPPPEEVKVERVSLTPAEVARLDAALRKAWQRWTAVVEAFVRGQGRARVSEEAYRELHTQLLEVCRLQAQAAEGAQQAAFRRLEGIAEPWVAPHSFAAADRDTLTDLLGRCRQVEQELGVSGGVNLWAWAAVLAALAMAAYLGWQLHQAQRAAVTPASLWATLKRLVAANPVQWTLLALPAVVLASIGFLVRRFRV